MPQEATFKLRCIGGHKDTRPARECKGKEPPMCKECFMPMVLVEVKITRGKH